MPWLSQATICALGLSQLLGLLPYISLCHFLWWQFSRLKSLVTARPWIMVMSPCASAAVGSLALSEALALGDGDAVGEGEPDGAGDADGLADRLGAGEALDDGLGAGEALADGLGVGAELGSWIGEPGALSSTWRNLSSAGRSSGATCSALLFGIETVMSLVPICTTVAPLKPCPFTRLIRIDIA